MHLVDADALRDEKQQRRRLLQQHRQQQQSVQRGKARGEFTASVENGGDEEKRVAGRQTYEKQYQQQQQHQFQQERVQQNRHGLVPERHIVVSQPDAQQQSIRRV